MMKMWVHYRVALPKSVFFWYYRTPKGRSRGYESYKTGGPHEPAKQGLVTGGGGGVLCWGGAGTKEIPDLLYKDEYDARNWTTINA